MSDCVQRREFLQRLSAAGAVFATAGIAALPAAAETNGPAGQKQKTYAYGFTLTDEQEEKLRDWQQEQDRKVMEAQKGTDLERPGQAYYGCSGGAYAYHFTPTSVGDVIQVTNSETNATIDLSDYDRW